ncbi:hypothetical protein HOV93_08740 [Planctomycetes bacterium FF15]|uniref:Uncharacterized protein n=1 Tax=Bremerella alba TaxID=980252 RepID=A0A7V9A5Y7_9BACT|nr:hypothetical protein [Bremerella alba]
MRECPADFPGKEKVNFYHIKIIDHHFLLYERPESGNPALKQRIVGQCLVKNSYGSLQAYYDKSEKKGEFRRSPRLAGQFSQIARGCIATQKNCAPDLRTQTVPCHNFELGSSSSKGISGGTA